MWDMNAGALLADRSRRMRAWRVPWLLIIATALCGVVRRASGPGRERAAGERADRQGVHSRWPAGQVRDADRAGNLRFYSTAMYADDVNQLLGDLHYAKANFIGGSYGTDAEQVFLLRHPARVRTMTLISGSPLNIRLFDFQSGNSQLALDHVFAMCQSQPACHQAFPHLAADWAALWASIGKSPWILPAAQSPVKTAVRLDQDGLASWIYNAMFDGNIGPIPVLVHTWPRPRTRPPPWPR
jgi:pimeloyl-ACP methyl ester carboxylesterase